MKLKERFNLLKGLGLKSRALTISLLPVLVIGLVLASLFTAQRFQELDQSLHDQGEMIAAAFAHGIFESMTQRQGHTLPFYAQRILEEDNVRSVAIHEVDGTLITRAGPKMRPLPEGVPLLPDPTRKHASSRLTDTTLRVIHPIYPASSYHPLAGEEANAGWLEVEIDRSNLVIAKYRSLLYTTLLLVIALAISGAVAIRFANGIGRVVDGINSALTEMSQGDLAVRLKEDAYGELRTLQSALNQLGSSILEGQQELQQNVDQATEDLRETLETIEIQNIELDLARKEALEASRIKSEFLANMSHEIRTPLNGIIGFTNLLLKSDISLTQRDYLDTIQKSSESLLSIINDILDFSKIEAGKLVLDQIPLNFQEVVEDVLTMLAPMAYEKHLEQVSLFYSDVPTGVIGDPLRLKQILTNLVNNAIKFTEHGEVVIRVMLDDQKDDLATIKVTVSDTGIGLTKEQQRALFSAFRQADTTTARRFGGTGLGLVISKHLVEQMRGEIGLDSEPGQGSTFWFTFRAKVHNKDASYVPLIINQSCKIAIYDVNATVRANLRNTLQKRKIEVVEYADMGALTNLLRSTDSAQPQAVILGVNAQKPKYTEITQLCKLNHHRIPLILHGNPADQTTLAELLDGDQLPLITKPLCQQKTYEVLGNLLESDAFDTESPDPSYDPLTVDNLTAEDLNIIAVDDNPANLKLLCALLEDLQVTVTACDSGMKALQQIEQRDFDLVLMDIQMPVMDGVETAQRIRSMEGKEAHTPIIAVTAHALASEKHTLLNSGMDDYVTKPINEAQLIHIIHKWTGVNLHAEDDSESRTADENGGESAVDMKLGLKLANNKEDLAEEMLEMLFNALQKDKDTIRVLLEDEDYETLQEVVHKLHGATRYTGVPFLQEASQVLEENLKLEKFEAVKVLTNALLNEIERVIGWCEQNRDMAAH
ncbi:MAG: hybrid sensor histidine kinase/response regulator [Pseudomonadales bacterium]|uniref:response regulator n=1 Tax=unclassified Ketobacter TaxID=2639109 RepID=UPI000C5E0E2F|nr:MULTISPECIES: response regulator [unclassified Ketobacter]MAA59411.1 hybrid sensor histidine kinase/response regulator [Pseudomonadales bacterium]MEC8813667.1 response regulator [Pseudomonadota bacterium]TNC89616.1 MAG: hybrid sensor histidine kinase/response regulator [Alcanivorax sp.]MAQ27144.1 hybrid sensor histidine kinase/response regulator [Pseudomonadales bacterium]MBI26977.1 hybrid sensor histidine kinase/response regulator [Pseudomonadales bacterium]